MAGNHDDWLCPFYEAELGATIIAEPYDLTVLRLAGSRLVHGHLLGARRAWKAWMEGPRSSRAFGSRARAARPRARRHAGMEQRTQARWTTKNATCGSTGSMLPGCRRAPISSSSAMSIARSTHGQGDPRLIVLGGWQARSSYLRVDETGASFHVEDARAQLLTRSAPTPVGRLFFQEVGRRGFMKIRSSHPYVAAFP